MEKRIKRAGVIGAGVMGATIAAQIANVGIETVLLDIIPPALSEEDKKKGLTLESKPFRNKFSQTGLLFITSLKRLTYQRTNVST